MADNTVLNTGSGGDTIATDDIGGIKHQRVKVQHGADGSATDVSSASPLPVDDAGGSLTVDGTGLGVVGAAAENAAVSGNPVLSGGRYDSAARTLGNGDVGAVALNASGHLIADVSASTGGTHTDDAVFTPGTDDGVVLFGFLDDTSTDSVDEGDAGAIRMSSDRIVYVQGDGPLGSKVNGQATMTASTADTAAVAAQGAGIKTYITDVIVTNTSATDTECVVKDGATELFRISAPANGGAVAVGFRSPVAGTANTAINAAAADSISSLYCFVSGFTSSV